MKTAKAAYDDFLKAVDTMDGKKAGQAFMKFLKTFGGVYAKYL